jgi:hypothetical protein
VGPTRQRVRERERGEAGAKWAALGRKLVGPAGKRKKGEVGRGVGWLFCFFSFFFSFSFQILFKLISNLLNSNLFHVFKLKF